MPKNPHPRYPQCTPDECAPIHRPVNTNENIKLQMMMTKLETSLKDEFILKEDLKTVNFESLLGKGDISIKSISRIEKTSTEGLLDTYTIYFNDNNEVYSFTIKNGSNGTDGHQVEFKVSPTHIQ
jgi:hypothetical protein